ncbi:MAG: glycosyltransferase family 1 protein [Fusobacteriaceae bacterium]|nr:glycosyltransferase family 1 protein [Fusobacteriaceae bacterium]
MCKLKIGLLHHGNEENIWGSVITTRYLEKAFKKLGHNVWRISVTEHQDYSRILSTRTDFFVSEGVPEWQIPKGIWDFTDKKIFWWLSELFYNIKLIVKSNFDGIATNSEDFKNIENNKKMFKKIDLAVDNDILKATFDSKYEGYCAYIGAYPHKTQEQMDKLFLPCIKYSKFGLWGYGWENSNYAKYHKGVLPIDDIGILYKSVQAALLLTEKRQQNRGMINNRVYEVLGSGCIAISEEFEYLEKSDLGKYIYFVNNENDFRDVIDNINSVEFNKNRVEAQKYVIENHNYINRAKAFIELYKKLET